MYVIGGRTGQHQPIGSVECLDNKDMWRRMYGMPSALSASSAIHIGGNIYIFGGQCYDPKINQYQETRVNTGLCYNIATQTWTNLTSLPKPAAGLSTLLLRIAIYVVDVQNKQCMYHSGKCSGILSGPKESMDGGQAVVWQDRILVLSWDSAHRVLIVEEYNPAKDQWLISRTMKPAVSKDVRCLRAVFVMRL